MKILIIDNYDSFTYNLVQLVGRFTTDLYVYRNDKISITDISSMNFDKIIISPGPGKPEDSKVSLEVIKSLGHRIPVLGVCLGHQAIGVAFNSKVVHAPYLMHGKTSQILHNNEGIYNSLPQKFLAGRYHSLVVDKSNLSDELIITSSTEDDIIMGVKHKSFPIEGIQFHPESILTEYGDLLIKNWLMQ